MQHLHTGDMQVGLATRFFLIMAQPSLLWTAGMVICACAQTSSMAGSFLSASVGQPQQACPRMTNCCEARIAGQSADVHALMQLPWGLPGEATQELWQMHCALRL